MNSVTKKRKRLQAELNKGQMIIAVTVIISCAIGFFVNNYFLSKRSMEKVVESTAYVLIESLTAPVMFKDKTETIRTLNSLATHPVLKGAIVLDVSGKPFVNFPNDLSLDSDQVKTSSYSFPIINQGESIGTIVLVVRDDLLPENVLGYGLVAMIVLIITALLAKKVAQLTSQEIIDQFSEILGVAKTITCNEQYSMRVLSNSEKTVTISEIYDLAAKIDLMLEAIETRNNKIHSINEGLEKAVEARTLELKEAQATLVHSSRLSALGEMAAGIAHEINNPLTIISCKCEEILLLLESEQTNVKTIAPKIDSIVTTIERISKIIKGLKSFSRDGAQVPFEYSKVKTIIDDSLEMCKTRFHNHGINLQIAAPNPNLFIYCCAIQIGQVIVNLLNNAHDAVLPLENKWVKLEVLEEEKNVVLRITDSGNGIPEPIRKKIMQPFFTTKELGKGTGLGLSISKGIIEKHGGSLEIDIQCQNTCFLVRLPKNKN